jgi:hypothetical protein
VAPSIGRLRASGRAHPPIDHIPIPALLDTSVFHRDAVFVGDLAVAITSDLAFDTLLPLGVP